MTRNMTTEDRARIDQEIEGAPLQRRHHHIPTNSLSAICRLPPELLANVFVRCAVGHYRKQRYLTARNRGVPHWVNVSRVCRYWREVALDCPSLWAFHFMVSLRWTEELLARSKEVLLKICLKFEYGQYDSWWLDPVKKLMDHAERFQELILYLPDRRTHRILSMLSSPAPLLEKLQISAPGFDSGSGHSFVPFHGDTPSLRALDLLDSAIPWYSFNLSSLRTLNVVRPAAQFRQSTVDFLATLSRMQDVTELRLYGVVLTSSSDVLSTAASTTSSCQEISLPCLVTLTVNASLLTVVTLLACIGIPLNAKIVLECFAEDHSSPDHFTLLSRLSSILTQRFSPPEERSLVLSSPTIRSLVINYTRWRGATFLFSSKERDFDAFNTARVEGNVWNCDHPLLLTVHCGESTTTADELATSDIHCSIPLANVETLYVIRPQSSPAFWRKTLGHLRNVRYIKLSDGDMPDLTVLSPHDLTACEDEENQISQRDRDRTLVPRLEELELSRIYFSVESNSNFSSSVITLPRLFDTLSSRGLPGGRLTMTECTIGGCNTLHTIRSWDGLINIPLTGGGTSCSYQGFDSGDGWDDDSESDLDGDPYNDSDDDYSEEDSEYYSDGYSQDDMDLELEGAEARSSTSVSESDSEGDSLSEDDSDGDMEGDMEGASERPSGSASEGEGNLEGDELDGDFGDHSDGDLDGDSDGGFDDESGGDCGDDWDDD